MMEFVFTNAPMITSRIRSLDHPPHKYLSDDEEDDSSNQQECNTPIEEEDDGDLIHFVRKSCGIIVR